MLRGRRPLRASGRGGKQVLHGYRTGLNLCAGIGGHLVCGGRRGLVCRAEDHRPHPRQRCRRQTLVAGRRRPGHGHWRVVHALHRHAGPAPAHPPGLRHRHHRVVPVAGRRRQRLRPVAGHPRTGQPRTPLQRRRGDGHGHCRHALRGHGRDADEPGDRLPPRVVHRLRADRHRRRGRRTGHCLSPARRRPPRAPAPRPGRRRDGRGHRGHALHRHGRGPLPRRLAVRRCLARWPVAGFAGLAAGGHQRGRAGHRHRRQRAGPPATRTHRAPVGLVATGQPATHPPGPARCPHRTAQSPAAGGLPAATDRAGAAR